jgi:RNA polymerase sigma-70 factor (ECF subfamily)
MIPPPREADRAAAGARPGHASLRLVNAELAPADQAAADRVLVSRMASGDEGAMRSLVHTHGATVFSLAKAILREAADAEEVAADAFMQAWRNASTFDPTRSSVIAWLGVIVRSRALDRLRTQARQGKVVTQESDTTFTGAAERTPARGETPDQAVEATEARDLVARALGELPESHRNIIELAYFGGLSQTEIATRLSMPLGTVKTRTLAAMRQLRTRLGPLLREELA